MRQQEFPVKGAKRPNTHPTIGLLISRMDRSNAALWSGVADKATEQGANLICFAGEILHSPYGYDTQANALYDLVSAETLDGLIIRGDLLGHYIAHEEARTFYERFQLPIVNVASQLRGIPSVSVDNYQGMHDLVAHLVQVHGCRRIVFIRGPQDHLFLRGRYRAYTDVLAESGIAYDPDLVVPIERTTTAQGEAAIQQLLDERGLHAQRDFEAVVSVNDTVAEGALEALQARGIQAPDDVALVGFDDWEISSSLTPPLTTVQLLFYEQAQRATEMLLALLAGQKNVPEQVLLPTQVVVRQSCGCTAVEVVQAAAPSTTDQALRITLAPGHEDILSEIRQAVEARSIRIAPGQATQSHVGAIVPKGTEQLLDAFGAELTGAAGTSSASPNIFLAVLDGILRQVASSNGDVALWHGVLSALRRQIRPTLSHDRKILSRAEDLWQQARVMIGERAKRVLGYRWIQAQRQDELLREVSETLSITFDVANLVGILAQELPRLGVQRCFLAVYENPEAPAQWCRLILAYDESGRIELADENQRFLAPQLVPARLLPPAYSLVILPLYLRDEQIGFVVFEISPREWKICDRLRTQISLALHNAKLYNEVLEAWAAAEKADQLKTRLLANVSHELRTPLNVILGYTRTALDLPAGDNDDRIAISLTHLRHIQRSAEHQLRLINDLLDLSRAEIDELELHPELIDARPFLQDAFHSLQESIAARDEVAWRLLLPQRLPRIQADPVRLRQILFNLLNNAAKFTLAGQITLGAEVTPPHLHLWVQDTGIGIPIDLQERIFEPFVTRETQRNGKGIGLGLSIVRRLVALHRGLVTLESQPGQGSAFHVYLPLPNLSDQPALFPALAQPILLLIGSEERPAVEIVELSQRQGLEIRPLRIGDDVDVVLAGVQPMALAWDLTHAATSDWTLIQQLRRHPQLAQTPFIFYGQESGDEPALSTGLTNFVIKPAQADTLLEAINALFPSRLAGPILIVDDDPQARELYRDIVAKGLPEYPIQMADGGGAALSMLAAETPSLVILDLMMPDVDGFDVLEWMRSNRQTRQVPVLILSGRMLTRDDVQRFAQYAQVTFQSKGILSDSETVASLHRVLFGIDTLPPQTGALVKQALAYLQQNYHRPLSHAEIAQAIGVSKAYLSRIFRRELGLSPWQYLNRYRIHQARIALRHTDDSVTRIALGVGFNDPSYFGRVFHDLVGLSPQAYRAQTP